jgi:hypothetical protein
MGFLDKFFGKQNSGNNQALAKTSVMLNEDLYWKVVSLAARKAPDQEEQEQVLATQLQRLSPLEIVGFKLRTDKLLSDIYNSNMWCAAYIMNGGCSDDGFEYFRAWVISRGKEVYYKAKAHPDSLVEQLNEEEEDYEFESFLYIPNDAFKLKTQKDIYDFIDDGSAAIKNSDIPIEFNWEEENPDTMKAICPRLFKAKMD